MTRKRKSTSSRSSMSGAQSFRHDGNSARPRSSAPSPSSTRQTPSLRPPSSAENMLNHLTAVVLASYQLISQGGSAAMLPIALIILFLVLVPSSLYLLSIYVLFPAWSIVRYPFIPFIWVFGKTYSIVYWLVSWIVAIFKGAAWLGFYLFFFGQFFTYITSAADWFLETIREEQQTQAQAQEQQSVNMEEDEWSDDDEPPPLEPATA